MLQITKKQFKETWGFDYNHLLSEGTRNTKLNKSEVITYGLSLTPDKVTCRNAELAGCISTCLVNTGRALMYDTINRARNNRKKLFYQDRELFMQCLLDNIEKAHAKYPDQTIAIRLNMFSDIQWELIEYKGKTIYNWFEQYDNIVFYDYTKIVDRYYNLKKLGLLHKVHLTFSYSPNPNYYQELKKALETDMNIAFIYNGSRPDKFLGRTVYNGDLSDYRPKEGFKRLAIALRYKTAKDNTNMASVSI